LLYSPDGGQTWENKYVQGFSDGLVQLSYNNGIYFAAFDQGPLMMSKDDGTSWVPAPSVLQGLPQPVGNNWLVVGQGGLIQYSYDGMNWQTYSKGISDEIDGLVLVPGTNEFLLSTEGGFYTSNDCSTWTKFSSLVIELVTLWPSLGLLTGFSNLNFTFSKDGSSWPLLPSPITNLADFESFDIVGYAYGNGVWVVAANARYMSFRHQAFAYTSTDKTATEWTLTYGQAGPVLRIEIGSVVFGKGKFILATDSFYTSTNGKNWQNITLHTPFTDFDSFQCILDFVGPPDTGIFLLSYKEYTLSSADGVTWNFLMDQGSSVIFQISSVSYISQPKQNFYVMTAAPNTYYYSMNGLSPWLPGIPINQNSQFSSVLWTPENGGTYCAASSFDNSVYSGVPQSENISFT